MNAAAVWVAGESGPGYLVRCLPGCAGPAAANPPNGSHECVVELGEIPGGVAVDVLQHVSGLARPARFAGVVDVESGRGVAVPAEHLDQLIALLVEAQRVLQGPR